MGIDYRAKAAETLHKWGIDCLERAYMTAWHQYLKQHNVQGYWFVPYDMQKAIDAAAAASKPSVAIGEVWRLKASKQAVKIVAKGYQNGSDFAEIQMPDGTKVEITNEDLAKNAVKIADA